MCPKRIRNHELLDSAAKRSGPIYVYSVVPSTEIADLPFFGSNKIHHIPLNFVHESWPTRPLAHERASAQGVIAVSCLAAKVTLVRSLASFDLW